MTMIPANAREPSLELPTTAPILRITAGAGSAGQKTWNIRRPVTLIGARRPAHIVVHDRDVSKAHCVIINTGSDVLIKDLHTALGTRRNGMTVELALLEDGDVIQVGNTRIQVAIRVPDGGQSDSDCGEKFVEPTQFAEPVRFALKHTDLTWSVRDAVALIGRHEQAEVRLDHPDVSTRHAVLFRLGDQPALYDLGSRTGTTVGGQPLLASLLRDGDLAGIGPCLLQLGTSLAPPSLDAEHSGGNGSTPAVRVCEGLVVDSRIPDVSSGSFDDIERELGALQANIAGAWTRLNEWESKLREDDAKPEEQERDLDRWEAELEAKDAALRGQLHDLTQYAQEIADREKQLAESLAQVRREQEKLTLEQVQLVEREDDVARRSAELQRREHVLAQRWARLLAANCPHCAKPIRIGQEAAPGPLPV